MQFGSRGAFLAETSSLFPKLTVTMAAVSLLACSGQVGSSQNTTGGQGGGAVPDGEEAQPLPVQGCGQGTMLKARLVRLVDSELQNLVRGTELGKGLTGKDQLAFTLQGQHFDRVRDRGLSSSDFAQLSRSMMQAARDMGKALPDASPCRQTEQAQACQDTVLQPLVSQLYRRPLDAAEWELHRDRHTAFVKTHGPREAFEAVVAAALLSPQTLYLTEFGSDAGVGDFRVSNTEALQRASFAFLGHEATTEMKAQLLELKPAEFRKALGELAAQWSEQPAFQARVAEFMESYLGLGHIAEVERSTDIFDANLKTAMRREFRAFVEDNLLGKDGNFSKLFTAAQSRHQPGLEKIYGANTVKGDRLMWDGQSRQGLLGLSGLLTAHARPSGSDPVQRGMLIRQRLLCEPMPPPIADADFSKVMTTADMQTRERFETLAQAAQCKSCHEVINPPGYLFENFDELGRYRTEEKGRPINATGGIPPFFDSEPYDLPASFTGIAPLSRWLSTSTEARRCFALHLAEFALADEVPEGVENCATRSLGEAFVRTGSIADLARDIVQSDLFLFRARDNAAQAQL